MYISLSQFCQLVEINKRNMSSWLILLGLVAIAYADNCHYGEAGSKPQSLVICKSLTAELMGKNIKLSNKPGPFDAVHDLELTNFTGNLGSNTLSMFPNLERLVIQDSNFPKINAAVFEKCCSKLKKLSIKNNHGATIEAGSFKTLKQLEELNISNKMPKLSKDLFLGLEKLKKLTLRKTKIVEIDENTFDSLKTLDTLEMYDNTFPIIKPNTLLPLKELKKFSILDNPTIKTFPLDLLKEQKKLELLGLPSELLSKIDLALLKKQIPTLKKLEVKVDDKKKFETYFKKAQEQNVIINYIGTYF